MKKSNNHSKTSGKTTVKDSHRPIDPEQYYSKRKYDKLLDAAHGCIWCVFNAVNQADDIDAFEDLLIAVAEEHEDRERRAGKI